jgi:TRAP transporter 4TM/12TM fusion protein
VTGRAGPDGGKSGRAEHDATGAVHIDLAGAASPPADLDPEHGLPPGFGSGHGGKLLHGIAIAFSLFQVSTAFGVPLDRPFLGITLLHLLTAGFALWAGWIGVLVARGRPSAGALAIFVPCLVVLALLARYSGGVPSQVLRAVHVGFLVLVASALLANHRAAGQPGFVAGWGFGLAGLGVGFYQWWLYVDLINRAGDLTTTDMTIGIVNIALVFLVAWRFLGPALPIVAGLFLAYCVFGQWLPAPLDHRGFSLEQVVDQMAYGTEGLYGTPTAVSATYIFLFILFGSFLERAGMIQLFTDLAMSLFGRTRGGPAKVAVFASALMGTISGSGVANVVSTGQFTIPLMKRFGYAPAFAGGVEATASMGGQIMPPVMGAVAFIMAETIDVPYAAIVQAAIVPAILYYVAAFWSVHLEAGKRGLVGLPRDMLPKAGRALAERWHLILPLAVLVYLLFAGYTPLYSGSVGLALTVVLILGGTIAAGLGPAAVRVAFWIALGIACAAFFRFGIAVVLLVVTALILTSALVQGGRETVVACREALADGARQAIPVGIACAMVGIVVGTMTLTGVGTIFGAWVLEVGRSSMVLALLLTMVVSLVLGMGIPTIPNYIITSSLAAPLLLQLGVPLIVSHMFVFYFGIMADLTPPVALAAFAAAPIARESGFRIGFQAVRIALPGFVLPFMAVYDPALMLQPVPGIEGAAYVAAVAWIVAKALIAILLWGAASIGFLLSPLSIPMRLAAAVAAALIAIPVPAPVILLEHSGGMLQRHPALLGDLLGLALAAVLVAAHLASARGGRAGQAAG